MATVTVFGLRRLPYGRPPRLRPAAKQSGRDKAAASADSARPVGLEMLQPRVAS